MCESEKTLVSREEFVLAIIDIQERLASAMTHCDRVVAAAERLAKCAALVDAPIIVTRQYPKGLGSTVEGLEATLVSLAEEGARVTGVDKMSFCCTADASFESALGATGRRQVVVVGMETHICVAQTALALAGSGYEVQVAADACCSRDDMDHDVALDRLRSAGVVVTTSEAIMYEAIGAAGTPEFKQFLQIVKD
ncbi:MAG: isochorismatase family protein [Coriobacteriia bacterium]|nr:isochorismatase family protein [Coriobacteriia bacterium]